VCCALIVWSSVCFFSAVLVYIERLAFTREEVSSSCWSGFWCSTGVMWLYCGVLVSFLVCLVGVAFLTLSDRKVLGFTQVRFGVSKPSFKGWLVPMLDAIKLLAKGVGLVGLEFVVVSLVGLVLVVVVLFRCGSVFSCGSLSLSFLLFLCGVGCVVYVVLLLGFFSVSKYGEVGSLRSVVSTMSYEVVLSLVVVRVLVPSSCGLFGFGLVVCVGWLLVGVFLLCRLAECNRAPFDFAEGESELVSGFNVEFGGVVFTLVFLSEYGFILVFCCVGSLLFYRGRLRGVLVFGSLFLLVRSS